MEFLVFVIYIIVVVEWIFGNDKISKKNYSYSPHGQSYYMVKGIVNMLVGVIGLVLFDYLLRDKNIIPVWSFWTGFIGLSLIMISGIIYVFKMLTATQP